MLTRARAQNAIYRATDILVTVALKRRPRGVGRVDVTSSNLLRRA
jgi:hypothetical protein